MKENDGKWRENDGKWRKITKNDGKWWENEEKELLFTCMRLPEVGPDEPLGPREGVVEVLLRGVVLVHRATVVLAQETEEAGPLILPHGGLACGVGHAWGLYTVQYCSLWHLFLWEFCPMHCKEILMYVFPEKKLRALSPNFHIHVSLSDLYISTFSSPIFLQQNRQIDQGI